MGGPPQASVWRQSKPAALLADVQVRLAFRSVKAHGPAAVGQFSAIVWSGIMASTWHLWALLRFYHRRAGGSSRSWAWQRRSSIVCPMRRRWENRELLAPVRQRDITSIQSSKATFGE
jgi:hypothetical protein